MTSGRYPHIDIHTHHHAEIDGLLRIVNVRLDDVTLPAHHPVHGSVGVHPWDADGRNPEQDATVLAAVVEEPWCVAVGEIGLDRVRGPALHTQRHSLDAQLDIAAQHRMPVILHCVRAHADLMQLRKQRRESNPWIIHGFTGHSELAGQLLQLDFHLSFGAAVLEVGSKAREALTTTPLNRLFFETDESGLDIRDIYRAAADLLLRDEEELMLAVSENFHRCFRVDP
ncbi:MAG: TatD family hydrolase [Bacteroidetes bacterium]|nr:TatD family hydrolase [Bacteroidota bacterium]